MIDSEEHNGQTGLKLWARDARVRSAAYAIQAARAAESAAVRKEHADRMIGRMAGRNPRYAERLLAIGVDAGGRRAAIDAPDRGHAADRPGGQLLPEPRNAPDAIAGPQASPRQMAIARERDRIVGVLHDEHDEVVRGVFHDEVV